MLLVGYNNFVFKLYSQIEKNNEFSFSKAMSALYQIQSKIMTINWKINY